MQKKKSMSISTQSLSGFAFDMRFPCVSQSMCLCVIVQIMFAGCTDKPVFTSEPIEDNRPTKSSPTTRVQETMVVIDDRDITRNSESQSLGLRTLVQDVKIMSLSEALALDERRTPKHVYMLWVDSASIDFETNGVSNLIERIRNLPSRSFVFKTDNISMSQLKSLLSIAKASKVAISLSIPLGMLAYTHNSIAEYHDLIDHYYYHLSGFWIPSASFFSGPLSENPFGSFPNGEGLVNFLTGEASIGSPIPRKDLDFINTDQRNIHVTIMLSPFYNGADCIEPRPDTKCTNTLKVTEFGALSYNQFVDFIMAFKNRYKFIHGFGISSYSAIPKSWMNRAVSPCCA